MQPFQEAPHAELHLCARCWPRNQEAGVAVNDRLGGRVSYLANSGFTQRRLHAAFDLATPIVPIFTVPEDY